MSVPRDAGGEELLNAAGEGCIIENIRPEIVEKPERVVVAQQQPLMQMERK